MTPHTVAMYCKVSKGTVLKWIKEGELVAYRLPSGHYRIEREDLKDFLIRYHIPVREEFFTPNKS